MLGSHLIRTWAKTQSTIALSSAEAELFGGVKTACETLGIASLLRDLGQKVKLRMHMDASAALGIAQRHGVGKVRHLSTSTLWLQEQELKKLLEILKVPGADNVADIFTKYLGHALMEKHLASMNLEYRSGRANNAAQLHYISKIMCERKKGKAEVSRVIENCSTAKSQSADMWEQPQRGRVWIREHRCPRVQLFTPMNVTLGPRHGNDVGYVRTTIGSYKHGGEFVVTNCWKNSNTPHKPLPSSWNGITMFTDKPVAEETITEVKKVMQHWR